MNKKEEKKDVKTLVLTENIKIVTEERKDVKTLVLTESIKIVTTANKSELIENGIVTDEFDASSVAKKVFEVARRNNLGCE